jgi:hypothetical protein
MRGQKKKTKEIFLLDPESYLVYNIYYIWVRILDSSAIFDWEHLLIIAYRNKMSFRFTFFKEH